MVAETQTSAIAMQPKRRNLLRLLLLCIHHLVLVVCLIRWCSLSMHQAAGTIKLCRLRRGSDRRATTREVVPTGMQLVRLRLISASVVLQAICRRLRDGMTYCRVSACRLIRSSTMELVMVVQVLVLLLKRRGIQFQKRSSTTPLTRSTNEVSRRYNIRTS